MKLSLVVMTPGKSQGQAIAIPLAQFLIGRDPQCNLRPASALISKRHCALLIRGETAYLRDFGSTNGTFLNEKPVKEEVELHSEDVLKVGPLVFRVRLEAATGTAAINRPTPPPPTRKPFDMSDDESAGDLLLSMQDDDHPASSANGGGIPEGSTVMDIVAISEGGTPNPDAEKEKPASSGKKVVTGNTSSAAKAILDKYMRRPRGS